MSKKKKKKKRSGTVTVEQHINKPAAFETKRHSEKSPASEKELHAKKLKKICFITALVTMALILILAVTAIVSTLIRGSKPKIDDYLHSSSAAVIDGYELDGAMMCVIFYDNYHEFAPYMNINTSLSLKKQYTDDSERIFDLFVRISKGDAQRLLCEAKGASDMGLTLSYTEKKALRARAYNTDLTVYPSAITEEDIYKTLELRALAAKYEAATKPTLKPELSEIEAYCAQNSNVYDLIDMMAFSIYYADDTDGAAAFTKDEAAAHAKVLSEAADRESFENAVRAIHSKFNLGE